MLRSGSLRFQRAEAFNWLDFFFGGGGGGGQRKHFFDKRFDRTITVAIHVIGLFCFCFFFSFSIFPSFLPCNTEVASLRLLKLPFNPQFKYMTLMYQQHMEDLTVLFLLQRNSRETVSLRQILNANSSVC